MQKSGKKVLPRQIGYKTIFLTLLTNKIITWKLKITTFRHLEIMH